MEVAHDTLSPRDAHRPMLRARHWHLPVSCAPAQESLSMNDYYFSDETDDVVCEICGGRSGVGIRRIMFDGFSCQHCLHAWYEGAGVTTVNVRAASLHDQEILSLSNSALPQHNQEGK